MALPTGYLLPEEAAEDRTFTMWEALVDVRLPAIGSGIRF
jgi:hypothetical protein